MRSTFSILYYINRGKVKADGTTAIMCRITIDGKSSVFTTGYYCNPECWNTKNETVKDGRTNGLLAARIKCLKCGNVATVDLAYRRR